MLGKQALLEKDQSSVKRESTSAYIYRLIILIAVGIIILDVNVIVHHIQADRARQAFIKSQVSALGSNNVPSSTKPSSKVVASYQVAPTLPKYIIIPAIHVNARVTQISTNPKNQIEAPGNIYDVGWYKKSSLPGQLGAMFIDGHVSSWTANGVFYNLKQLAPGDKIQIVRGDNKTFTYVVKQLKTYSASNVDMTQALAPFTPGGAGLNLMTCTGKVITGTSEFNERLVVYSVLM